MKDNVFMISDASFSSKTKVAGIGVVDLYTQEKYSMSVENMLDPYSSELRALIYSIEIAIKNGYKHVVFVYDNKSLKLDGLIEYVKDKFISSQFLWLKRNYVSKADKLASKSRKIQESLLKNSNVKVLKPKAKIKPKKITMPDLLKHFKKKDNKSKLLLCMLGSSDEQKKILEHFIKGTKKKNIPKELFLTSKKYSFYKFIYYVLSKDDKNRFLNFIKNISVGKLDTQSFSTSKKENFYVSIFGNIVKRAKDKKHKGIKQ